VENSNVVFAFEDEAMQAARKLGNRFFADIDAESAEDEAE
jgi:hypothetical protein